MLTVWNCKERAGKQSKLHVLRYFAQPHAVRATALPGTLGTTGPGQPSGDAGNLRCHEPGCPKNIQTPNNKYNKFSKKCRTSDRAAPITETYELA